MRRWLPVWSAHQRKPSGRKNLVRQHLRLQQQQQLVGPKRPRHPRRRRRVGATQRRQWKRLWQRSCKPMRPSRPGCSGRRNDKRGPTQSDACCLLLPASACLVQHAVAIAHRCAAVLSSRLVQAAAGSHATRLLPVTKRTGSRQLQGLQAVGALLQSRILSGSRTATWTAAHPPLRLRRHLRLVHRTHSRRCYRCVLPLWRRGATPQEQLSLKRN